LFDTVSDNIKLISTIIEDNKFQEHVYLGIVWDANAFYSSENGYLIDNGKKGLSEDELIDYYVNLAK